MLLINNHVSMFFMYLSAVERIIFPSIFVYLSEQKNAALLLFYFLLFHASGKIKPILVPFVVLRSILVGLCRGTVGYVYIGSSCCYGGLFCIFSIFAAN